jgi:nitroreductase
MKKNVLIIGLLLIGSLAQAQMGKSTSSMTSEKPGLSKEEVGKLEPNIWDVFLKRRSVRNFRSDAIPESDIVRIVDAARMAPTSGNQQPWKFLVIRDRKVINQMMEACVAGMMSGFNPANTSETKEQYADKLRKRYSEGYFSAPVFIVILTDNNSKYPDYNHWDGPLAAGYLMLAARSLGYGTVFITDAIPDEITTEVLKIPANYTRVCITPLGVPVEWPATPEKKKLENFISYDKL